MTEEEKNTALASFAKEVIKDPWPATVQSAAVKYGLISGFAGDESMYTFSDWLSRIQKEEGQATRPDDGPTAPSPSGNNGWRPIAEAPKDGTRLLLIGKVYGGIPFAGVWVPTHFEPERPWLNAITATRLYEHVPTHFMPLPPPPIPETEKNDD